MIFEYEEKYAEEVKDLLVELQEHIVNIDKEKYNKITPPYRELYFSKTLDEVKKYDGKIFLYKEDFEKFMNGLQQAIQFIAEEQGPIEPHHTENEEQETTEDAHKPLSPNEIKIDIDF